LLYGRLAEEKESHLPQENAYIPDSHIIFPSVFLADVEKLNFPNCLYRDCFNILKRDCNYVLLPSNYSDFSNLILDKFYQFLKSIEVEICYARDRKTTETEFYFKTRSRLRNINTFKRRLGDLMLYWETHREFFWSLVSIDFVLARKKLTQLTNSVIAELEKISSGHLVEFSESENKLSEGLYKLIRNSRIKSAIQHQVHDEDILILADCFIYKTSQYPYGFMYIVTDDNELYGATEEIVKQPCLVLEGFKPTEHFVGFEPLRPKKFMDDRRK
jgi:hypothetical protein